MVLIYRTVGRSIGRSELVCRSFVCFVTPAGNRPHSHNCPIVYFLIFFSFRFDSIFFWDFGKAAFYLIFCDTYVCADHSCIAPRKCNCFEGNRHALRRRNLLTNGVLFDLLQVIDECDGERLKIWKIVIYNNLLTVLELLKSQIFLHCIVIT